MELIANLFKNIFKTILFTISCVLFSVALYDSFQKNGNFEFIFLVLVILFILKYGINYLFIKSANDDDYKNAIDDIPPYISRSFGDKNSAIELILFISSLCMLLLIGKISQIDNVLYYIVGFICIFFKLYLFVPIYLEYSSKTKLLAIISYVVFLVILFILFVFFKAYFSYVSFFIISSLLPKIFFIPYIRIF